MRDSRKSLENLRIASLCRADWEQMKGDDRVRFCELCQLHVYNFAQLSRKEANALVVGTEGRLCARLYRRADGTVITRDCPVGLQALRRRVARITGAVFATLMSMATVVAGQNRAANDSSCSNRGVVGRRLLESTGESGVLTGTIFEVNCAIVPGAKISITNQKTRTSINTEANGDGQFSISGLLPGTYDILVAAPGFKQAQVNGITLALREVVALEVRLETAEAMGAVGIVVADGPIDIPGGKLIINEQLILRRPR